MRLLTLNELPQQGFGPEDEDSTAIKWRRLTAPHTRLRSGWSQPCLPEARLEALTTQSSFSIPNLELSIKLTNEKTTVLDDDVLQHSLVFHDTLSSSQIKLDAEADRTVSFSLSLSNSSQSGAAEPDQQGETEQIGAILQVPPNLVITSLSDLPGSRHLHSIYPQTLTPSLLCVLATPVESREMLIRRGGHRMHFFEINVADKTRSGFKISFWFRPKNNASRTTYDVQESLLQTLEQAKVGDILLLRNIALNVFRNEVYGQSLNAAITRARTVVEVVMKRDGSSYYQLSMLPSVLEEKFWRVQKWASFHVASDHVASGKRKRSTRRNEDLQTGKRPNFPDDNYPPDTLEARVDCDASRTETSEAGE
ncbi:hypothetical protein CC78DRAFT_568124 [Lojkania enalia]|uniref:Uncharacterized protein n=1 Tax=Lojkania enalia TaxID=147567 RepID=A0A9P4KDV0_9PLEO|nr:hypothetical protein CC78DRAFT_568124 [Didymosphaeria enalia]